MHTHMLHILLQQDSFRTYANHISGGCACKADQCIDHTTSEVINILL